MDDCCAVGGEGADRYEPVFTDRFAERIARRYAKNGLTPPERCIVDYLADDVGLEGASVLEIGGGIGEIQVELIKRGAAASMNLELSSAYETVAGRVAAESGTAHAMTRRVGIDLALHPDAVDVADVVILHRVVCCYPDATRLLSAAAGRARRAVVFTHPPRTLLSRFAVTSGNLLMRLQRRSYRGYVHSPDAMVAVLERNGFEARYHQRAGSWRVVGAVHG